MNLLLALLSGWMLWHDVGIYEAAGHTRLGGTTYAATSYETETGCHTGKREAMAHEALPRRGPRTERILDGVMVWDLSGEHYTTFRYRCEPTGVSRR